MGITVLELVKAKVREVEALDEQIAHLARRRESLAEEIAAVRETLGASAPLSVFTEPSRLTGARPASASSPAHTSRLAHARLVQRAVTAEPCARLGAIAARTGLTLARAKYVIETMRQRGWLTAEGVKAATRYSAALPVPEDDAPVAPPRTRGASLPTGPRHDASPDAELEVSWHGGLQTSPLTGQSLTNGAPVEAYRQRADGSAVR